MKMKLFSRWKRGKTETLSQNNKPMIIRHSKHSLFDDIVGFDDVKLLFEMSIYCLNIDHAILSLMKLIK